MTSLLSHFPGTPRDSQVQVLEFLQENWSRFDVFSVSAPVAFGKSRVARAVAAWLEERGTQSSILTPNNVLVRQYAEEFPELTTLGRKDSYAGPTAFHRARTAAESAASILANYYTFVGNRLFRDTILVDEAHNVLPMLRERWSKKLWQREWHFPDDLQTVEDFVMWAETASLPEGKRRMLADIVRDVVHDQNYVLEVAEEMWRGRVDNVLLLKPLTVRNLKPWMWNGRVRKIVLLSATISQWEIHELGLDRRRVAYFEADSAIPAVNRPVVFKPIANMAYENRRHSIPVVAEYLAKVLAERPSKGLIHATYDVAAQLRGLLGHERLIWHTSADKARQYNKFRASENGVMVASGMGEGIDLAYDAARWQVVTQVPYPSLADSAVAIKAHSQPLWYQWETVKALLQVIGRVCRAPDDYGLTEIIDSQGPDFYRRSVDAWPQHVRNSVSIITANV